MLQDDITKIGLRKRMALEVWRRMVSNAIIEHPLRQLFWECTLRCNLHCRHCGSDCHTHSSTHDMPLEDFLKVLDGISLHTDPHKVFVILTGGEPLMRKDLEVCGREIYRRGFPWGMVSNGLALTPERFAKLREAGLHSITLSLDGLEQVHNWMRGNPNSFKTVDQAIDMLVKADDIIFDIVTCVNRRNYSQLGKIRKYLVGKGVKAWRLFSVFPVGRAALDPMMHLEKDEYRGMMEFIRETRKANEIKASYGCEGFLGNLEGEVRDNFFICRAGITVGSVLSDGSISACPSIRSGYHQGNIYQDDFMEVWQKRFSPFRDREWKRNGECKDCRFFKYCQGNGMHLRDADGNLLFCHLKRLLY